MFWGKKKNQKQKRNRKKEYADKFCYVKLNEKGCFTGIVEINKNYTHTINENEKYAHLQNKEWWEKFWYLASFRKKGYYFYYS